MAMKGIPSAEKVPLPVASLGDAPKHTDEDHVQCAYYWVENAGMRCPHGMETWGAVYSEDYVNSLRRLSHQLLERLDFVYEDHQQYRGPQHPRYYIQNRDQFYDDDRWLAGPIEQKDWNYTRSMIEELRELTK